MRHDNYYSSTFLVKYIEEQVGISHYELTVYCYNYRIMTHPFIERHLEDMR